MSTRKECKEFWYTKRDGDTSHRRVIILRTPSNLYLGLDVSDLTTDEINSIIDRIEVADKYRDELYEEMKVNNRWRSFKPEGIDWIEG